MISLFALWLPVLAAAVATFLLSSLIHMVFKYHNSDFAKLPDEDKVSDALRPLSMPPGDYMIPHCPGEKERNSDEYKARLAKGPVALMTVYPNGDFAMGKTLAQWFVYCVLVSVFVAYVTRMTLAPGTEYMEVSRVASVAAFMAYGLALMQNSIWYNRSWSSTLKAMFDSLVYALFTGGVFGWLWPTGM